MPGGRPPGSPTKSKRGLKARLKQEWGDDFDVIMLMGKNCKTLCDIAEENIDTNKAGDSALTAITALDRLAQYVEHKLKSIEISGEIQVEAHELTPTERAARIAALLEQARAGRDGQVIDGRFTEVDEPAGSTDDGSD